MRFAVFGFLLSSVIASGAEIPSADLYRGWMKMYDLRFDEAHVVFGEWKQSHPADSLGPTSNAAAYLFSELARLGVLESELFTDDTRFISREKPRPDPNMKALFQHEIALAERAADATLQTAPGDPNALFAKSLTYGLRADFASLIEKQDLTALKYTKEGRSYADRLTVADPKNYDVYLGLGVENYLLSLKPAPLRAVLWLTGSHVDHAKGIEQLHLTAQQGHYLEPFAKLLLAVAALRDNNLTGARDLLTELHNRFPNNPLYLLELNRITLPAR